MVTPPKGKDDLRCPLKALGESANRKAEVIASVWCLERSPM